MLAGRAQGVSDHFKKSVTFAPAYDKRDPDPSKNYGIGGVRIRFVLVGPKGAVQFLLLTDWYPAHVQREVNPHNIFASELKPRGADVGYHSPKPRYDGQESMGPCEHLDGAECFYDGSGLRAMEWVPEFLEGGDAWVWRKLEGVYREVVGEEQDDG